VQDTLLPTVAYIGGPAEIAYMAQVEVVYAQLMNRMPAILPRPGFTLVPPHVARLLKKYGLSPSDIFQGRQRLGAILAAGNLPRGLARRFERDEKALQKVLKGLEKPLGRLDKSLLGALGTAERKMLYQLAKLRRKTGKAEALRSGVLERHEQILFDSLFPQRGLQERSLCLLPFIASFGTELLDELYKRTASPPEHHILYL
ncbi:MAG: bacillithiol biosynthesis BshC, partial [Candidatus Acidiferrales bacterium]